jgi:hypothetical protein
MSCRLFYDDAYVTVFRSFTDQTSTLQYLSETGLGRKASTGDNTAYNMNKSSSTRQTNTYESTKSNYIQRSTILAKNFFWSCRYSLAALLFSFVPVCFFKNHNHAKLTHHYYRSLLNDMAMTVLREVVQTPAGGTSINLYVY